MAAMERPDWQSVMSYVTSIYKHFEIDAKSWQMSSWRFSVDVCYFSFTLDVCSIVRGIVQCSELNALVAVVRVLPRSKVFYGFPVSTRSRAPKAIWMCSCHVGVGVLDLIKFQCNRYMDNISASYSCWFQGTPECLQEDVIYVNCPYLQSILHVGVNWITRTQNRAVYWAQFHNTCLSWLG